MRTYLTVVCLAVALSVAAPVGATGVAEQTTSATVIAGVITDATGAALAGATVALRDVATGREKTVVSGPDGKYAVEAVGNGTFLVLVTRVGFSEAARTVVVTPAERRIELPLQLELGTWSTEVSVTAARAAREIRQIPLHVETLSGAAVAQTNPASTGDALAAVANITPVGNGPFGVRPRLRGLDSTRLLVLVDGERLNTARQATDRTGAEVGLISPDAIARMEIVNGAGTLMYGSDALAGTINIITNEPTFSDTRQFLYGANSFYSSNENGRRGTLTFGVTAPRYAIRVQGGAEQFDNYRTGAFTSEDTNTFFTSGRLTRVDTIDDNFGFAFKAFPDPFNAPYVRTDDEVLNSQAKGYFVNASALVKLAERRTLKLRYQQRRMEDVGFPDFAQPYFFNATSLPHSRLDRASVRYEAQAVTPWLANLSVNAYFQRTERLLANSLPVQFPAPTAVRFFPIAVMRLDILSETEQRVWTPGVDIQAVWVPATNHLLTTGATFYRDRSSDRRTTATTTSMVGQVVMGARGPQAVVFPAPVVLGPASLATPVRVPDASLQNIALFTQDEWRIRPDLSLTAGLRGDFYNVTTDNTPGYTVDPLVAGATPTIDPATLPDPAGASYSRNALTGDIGLMANTDGQVSPFVRFGRTYRHPNLEEMLFAGPATVGNIAPNVLVKPEIGNNFDVGAKFRVGRVSGGAYAFLNQYQNFIAQDLVVASTPAGPLAQATNYADVRISGLEFSIEAPLTFEYGVFTVAGSGAFTRGTITDGFDPMTGDSLKDTPADNITPSKLIANARFTQSSGRWWVEYGVRAQSEVDRVAQALLNSPFLIAQDLLSLDTFVVQRASAGINLTRGRDRVALTFAVENLTNRFYREHFQFAPSRGRSFTLGLSIGAF
jgi:hemoglobin/transferrin/lactoferrin receptor protein